MKNAKNYFLIVILGLAAVGCDEPARNKPKIYDPGNAKQTSSYGGCNLDHDCWDYKGTEFAASFANKSLQKNCDTDGGSYVTNGCSYGNLLASCVIGRGTPKETVVHTYKSSPMDADDVALNCQVMDGELEVFE